MSRVDWASDPENVEASLTAGDRLRENPSLWRCWSPKCGNPNHRLVSEDGKRKYLALWHSYEITQNDELVCEGSWKFPDARDEDPG